MAELTAHWTERGVDDYVFKIASDFVRHIEGLLDSNNASQATLARKLGVSEGRISQVLNNPGNLTLRQIIKYARALGQKVSIVAYEDGDSDNLNGPINAEVFVRCWETAGKPADFFSLRTSEPVSVTSVFVLVPTGTDQTYRYDIGRPTTTSTDARDLAGRSQNTASTLQALSGQIGRFQSHYRSA